MRFRKAEAIALAFFFGTKSDGSNRTKTNLHEHAHICDMFMHPSDGYPGACHLVLFKAQNTQSKQSVHSCHRHPTETARHLHEGTAINVQYAKAAQIV